MDESLEVEDQLLYAARNGKIEQVKGLVKRCKYGDIPLNLNCKGKSKANLGWTPLHLCCYFGHLDVASILLENGANINVMNDVGDTPLHRAAYTGRMEVVLLLIQHGADVCIVNGEGLTSKQVALGEDIANMLDAAQQSFKLKTEKTLLAAAREGDIEGLKQLVLSGNPPDINCSDANGNTPLHCASYRDHKEAAVLLLQCGIDSDMKNSRGQTALDLAQTSKMKQLLDVKPVKTIQKSVDMFEGQLMKKSRWLGLKCHWVVIDKGVISYFKRRADAVSGVKRQGFKYLNQAKFKINKDDATSFAVQYADRSTHMWSVAQDSQSPIISRQKWLNILCEHCEYSNHYTKSEPVDDDDIEDLRPLGSIQDVLQVANAHKNLLEQQVEGLQIFLDQQNTSAAQQKTHSLKSNVKYQSSLPLAAEIRQLAQQLMYSSKEMYNSMTHCLNIMTQQEQLRKLQLEQESEKSRVLADALHVLAKEHHTLEEKLAKRFSSSSPLIFDSSDDVFCDAAELSSSDADSFHSMSDLMDGMPGTFSQLTISDTTKVIEETKQARNRNQTIKTIPTEPMRTNLPCPMIKRDQFSLWTVLKQCIGKELSKMTMPVVFNEPLSFLQRFSEYVEYADLLDKAGQCDNVVERMMYIATFIVSSGASNIERVSKPFNPLLGETFELTCEEYGLRQISEQVCHHPPISAFHASANNFEFHGSVNPKLKFWGKSLEVTPKGVLTIDLPSYDESYTWHSISSAVHNLIVGKVWIEQYGHMEIVNHKTGHRCFLHFKPAGWFGKDLHKVEGYIVDKKKKKLCYLFGNWTEYFYSMDADSYEQAKKTAREEKGKRRHSKSNPGSPTVERGPGGIDNLDFGINPEGPEYNSATLMWRVSKRPDNSAQYYCFTKFALQLNNFTPAIMKVACPTDGRLRPDIRHLENGDIDSASDEKHRLEEKQRAARKLRTKQKETWHTRWFKQDANLHTGEPDWIFNGQYWARDYSDSPDVF